MDSSAHISEIQLFNALKEKLGEAQAEKLVGYVKSKVEEEVRSQHSEIATKDFVKSEISEAKFQIILWAFVFWATQLIAIFMFLKFFIQ